MLIEDLIAHNPSKNKAGRKVNAVTDQLSVACEHTKTGAQYWRCAAPGCNHFRAGNRQQARVLLHAMGCPHLSSELKGIANDTSINQNAPGVKVHPKIIQADTENQGAAYKKAKTIQTSLLKIATTTGKIKYQDEVNLAIVELFAVTGIPASVLDSPQWKGFVRAATRSKCHPLSSTMLTEKLIPAEAALVRKYQADFLRTCVNLTLTFDGGSTRKPSSVYTIHITTAERETFFMEGHDATDERHTAGYIEGLVAGVSDEYQSEYFKAQPTNPQVVNSIGPQRFTAMCSDNTGNTKKARRDIAKKFPMILNLADVCHHLSNTAKDISKLPEFQKVR